MIKSTKSALLARRSVLAGAGAMAALHSGRAWADTTGVTDTEIKIGNTTAYSGPASAYSAGAKALVGYWKMVNEQGGVNGRKINFLSLDDGYQPAKTVEVVRKLVEEDKVAFLSCPLGTACNSAIQRYMNQKKVPQLFVASGADK